MQRKNNFWTGWIMPVTQLIRLPNLLIIILTQGLLRVCVLQNLHRDDLEGLSDFYGFVLLVLATVLIAIAGYVINDYYDVRIDEINKPGKQVVASFISYRGAIKVHLLLNGIAILIGIFLAIRIKVPGFGLIFPFIAGLLWLYSAKYKRMVFWGNFIVALLSSIVILIVWLFFYYSLRLNPTHFELVLPYLAWTSRIFMAYALFAFLVSLFREIIKDMEDQEGDKSYGCRTLPLVIGIKISRFIVLFIVVLTILILGYLQFFLYSLDQYLILWYLLVAVQLPMVILVLKLFFATEKKDFHFMSTLSKVIMLSGILSMLLLLTVN